MISSEHCRQAIFQIYNVQNLEITRITTFHICNVVYQAGPGGTACGFFNFLCFFEETLYKSNYIIFILSWCRTHTKISSTSVMVTTGSQKITVWGPSGTPLGILRVNCRCLFLNCAQCAAGDGCGDLPFIGIVGPTGCTVCFHSVIINSLYIFWTRFCSSSGGTVCTGVCIFLCVLCGLAADIIRTKMNAF
jgi:hypothetical protein